MREDIQHTEVRERREDNGAVRVANKVEEGRAEGHNTTVGSEAVAHGRHGVLTDAKADVALVVRALEEVPKKNTAQLGLDCGNEAHLSALRYVKHEGFKSAEPPTRSGIFEAKWFRICLIMSFTSKWNKEPVQEEAMR